MANNPFKGPVPYSETDKRFFFGRDVERKLIVANMRTHRLTLLYGPSGVGKTSLLHAAMADHSEIVSGNFNEDGASSEAAIIFSEWHHDPLRALIRTIQSHLEGRVRIRVPETTVTSSGLVETLGQCTETLSCERFIIILDAFEENFASHPQQEGERTFALEFLRAVNCPDLLVNFLVSIREDCLAKLDWFKDRIPNFFENSLRLDLLDIASAQEIIKRSVDEYNRTMPDQGRIELEVSLVEEILAEISTGKGRVEPSQLQLVMSRLWHEALMAGSHVLGLETLARSGGARGILELHFQSVIAALNPSERDVTAELFQFLMTPSGARVSLTLADLATYINVNETDLKPLVDKLLAERILRALVHSGDQPGLVYYEVVHDVLSPTILAWRHNHRIMAAREQARSKVVMVQHQRQLESTVRRLRWWVVGLAVFSALAAIAAVIAWLKMAH